MGPLSLPCFGRFASRTRVTSDKRDGASLDLILLTLAFRHTERKILPPHSIFIPLPSTPLLSSRSDGLAPPSGKDRKSLDVSFRPVGRSHTRCWGDNEPGEREERGRQQKFSPRSSALLSPSSLHHFFGEATGTWLSQRCPHELVSNFYLCDAQ